MLRARAEQLGRRVIRDHLPVQHQTFYRGLSYLFVGSVAADGQPVASMLTGAPGFVAAGDDELCIAATPRASDPLADNLEVGSALGILGMDMSNRRRNRINGRVSRVTSEGISVAVDQAFGNCPRYIHTRTVSAFRRSQDRALRSGTQLDGPLKELVGAADTFFIATANPAKGPTGGADVSHRGGRSGFVHVDDAGAVLTFPDFAGNGHFNTLGNLAIADKSGLLFVDFVGGDVLQLMGRADVLWEGAALDAFDGAQRLVRFEVRAFLYAPACLAVSFEAGEASPFVAQTGAWA